MMRTTPSNTQPSLHSPPRIGILSGAGPMAGSLFFQLLIQGYYQREVYQLPDIRLVNFPFVRGLTPQEKGTNENTLQMQVDYCLDLMANQEITHGVLTCNTLHIFLRKNIPHAGLFIDLPQNLVQALEAQKVRKTFLLSTATTSGSDLYQSEKLHIILPNLREIEMVSAIIDRVLEGKLLPEDAASIQQLLHAYQKRDGIDSVILGCTELPVLHHAFSLAIPGVFVGDSLREAVTALVNKTT